MKAADRTRLTTALRAHVASIAADLRAQMRAEPADGQRNAVRLRARALYDDEQVGEDFDAWTDLLSRRAAVLWVLKSVYVRVLEDRGLLSPGRLLDRESQDLFERLAPNLGETAFLRWIYKDLAAEDGGLPELFAPQPAEVCLPSDALSRALLEFWRHEDADTGAYWSFAHERFEGELMGDLYQELDPEVKSRYALCQTPDFVRGFILDRTLTPAIEAYGADVVRLLDPACGSGHFLIDGLKRLVEATAAQHEDWGRGEVVAHCLQRVVGIDLNDYACALARARLVMTAAELAGQRELRAAARFHPHVYWADGLEQVEKGADSRGQPLQFDLFRAVEEEAPRAMLTRPEVRAALGRVLEGGFHAVVANPPYITEKDKARKAYHREKVGRKRRYVSAYREYSLGSPFTERCFQLAVDAGYVGLITSNNFMKREFGKPLIQQVLAGLDLTLVVDTSQAYIPFHGTPTVLLFGRKRRPQGESVRAVMGKRGETGTPEDPAKGQVWGSIAEGWDTVGFENEFVSVAEVPRETFGKHPWSLGGGGAAELKERLERVAETRLADLIEVAGFGAVTREDEVFVLPPNAERRWKLPSEALAHYGYGEAVRDWANHTALKVVCPYSAKGTLPEENLGGWIDVAWRYRTQLWGRQGKGFKTKRDAGGEYYEYSMFYPDRHFVERRIAFAFVATHNHFVLDRGGKVFNRTAPVIKLPESATEEHHLALLGLLNSSTACFWMKQVFFAKGGVDRCQVQDWDMHYEHDATKLRLFPIAAGQAKTIVPARILDQIARQRSDASLASLLADAPGNAASLRHLLDKRRAADLSLLQTMVALQEELDWLCYALYGLTEKPLANVEQFHPVPPSALPWTLTLAAGNNDSWFERHGWTAQTDLPTDVPDWYRQRVADRQTATRNNKALQHIEQAAYKRRWYKPDYEAEEREALTTWLADRVEAVLEQRGSAATFDQLTAALQDDPKVLAVSEVLTGRRDFSLADLVHERLVADSVPQHPYHIYKPNGLEKRAAWEQTWEDQRKEDAGEDVKPQVPPKYTGADFQKPDYYRHRGKLDVPKERFTALTEVPGRTQQETLYVWAGQPPLERLKTLLQIDEDLDDAGVELKDRMALLDSAWRLLPEVARQDPKTASRLKAELQAIVGQTGPNADLLAGWQEANIAKRPTARR